MNERGIGEVSLLNPCIAKIVFLLVFVAAWFSHLYNEGLIAIALT